MEKFVGMAWNECMIPRCSGVKSIGRQDVELEEFYDCHDNRLRSCNRFDEPLIYTIANRHFLR